MVRLFPPPPHLLLFLTTFLLRRTFNKTTDLLYLPRTQRLMQGETPFSLDSIPSPKIRKIVEEKNSHFSSVLPCETNPGKGLAKRCITDKGTRILDKQCCNGTQKVYGEEREKNYVVFLLRKGLSSLCSLMVKKHYVKRMASRENQNQYPR
ncbi:hypothetical protein CDAR_605031 [Caerostris darwini]|uniref:Uncharacterized protein n=1 Tax=Caerostris darwini TaxID=1538125 RepID=A0AAV4X3W9_9ARAC|nr:hypothetical protein CDAR_605031 [Caerostris darwini]